jgi:hypothetical protein
MVIEKIRRENLKALKKNGNTTFQNLLDEANVTLRGKYEI